MDRIEKILVFVVVATIVVMVTIALSNSGDSENALEADISATPGISEGPGAPGKSGDTASKGARSGTTDLPTEVLKGKKPDARVLSAAVPETPVKGTPSGSGPETDKPRAEKPKPRPVPRWNTTYVVKKNESFWSISQKVYGNGKYWQMIQEANRDVDPDTMVPRTVLYLPPLKKAAAAKKTPALEVGVSPGAGYRSVKLKKGDYLYALLRRMKMEKRLQDVLALNGLNEESARNLEEGYELKIPLK